MNMLREFCNYFFSVMMGRRDSLTAFIEPLTMGERYLRWGSESRDIRDFRSAMDHLHLCYDRDAPMAGLLIRKYNCISEVAGVAIENLLQKHQGVIDAAFKTEKKYRDELETINSKLSDIKLYIRKLRAEGSLIKVKSEESRQSDMEVNGRRLQEMLDSGEGRTEIFDSYDSITSDAVRFFRELDHASTMVLANPMLGEHKAESMAAQLRARMDRLREQVEKANPVNAQIRESPTGKASPSLTLDGKRATG